MYDTYILYSCPSVSVLYFLYSTLLQVCVCVCVRARVLMYVGICPTAKLWHSLLCTTQELFHTLTSATKKS